MTYSAYQDTSDYRDNVLACKDEQIIGKAKNKAMLSAFKDYCLVYGFMPIFD